MTQDTLSDLLRSVRLRGALYFHVDCTAPWVTEAPKADVMTPVIMPDAEQLMEYHVVIEGRCWAGLVGESPVQLQQGDVIVFPHGDAHVLSSDPGMRAAPDTDFLYQWRPPQLPFMLRQGIECSLPGARGPVTAQASVLCGFLGCDRRPFNPLLASLPRMIHASAAEFAHEGEGWIAQFAQLASTETRRKRPGGEAVLERLSELMFVDLLRRYLERLPEEQRGWLAGLRDRHVGRALGLMHERPAKDWTIDQIAGQVGLSRSALHDRFVQFIGLRPMQYLTNWRMQVASGLLVQSSRPLASVAQDVGYDSEAAFSRAFKRAVGVPPSVWRRERAASARSSACAGIVTSDVDPQRQAA